MDALSVLNQAQDAYAAGRQSRLANKTGDAINPDKAREAAQQFEAFFASQMLEYMWTDIGDDPMFGGGHAEEMWRSMMNQEYGKEIAKRGSLGISDQVYAAMLKSQEERTRAQTALQGIALPENETGAVAAVNDTVAALSGGEREVIPAATAAAAAAAYRR